MTINSRGTDRLVLDIFIKKEQEGTYFNLPFEVPKNVDRMDIQYSYSRSHIVDLALSSANNEFIGASGSDREHIWICESLSSDGYKAVQVLPGTWNIIAGAYKITSDEVPVRYEITYTYKKRTLLKGDCHVHTTASDGVLTVEELIPTAKSSMLDFICITDHNNYTHNIPLRNTESLTVIPGVEWTLYNGHANMLGLEKPIDGQYFVNTSEEAYELLNKARQNGALISINHPFDDGCPWKWGYDSFEFDCMEVWNGIFKHSDMKCISFWHDRLCQGKRIPIIGGSDFHRFSNYAAPGFPTTWVYSMSRGQTDLLNALRQGHCFVTYQPDAPIMDITCNQSHMGDAVAYEPGLSVIFNYTSVKTGDIIKILSSSGLEKEITSATSGNLTVEIKAEQKKFYRTELYRNLLPGFPPMLCMISNPIYLNL